ncbi:hypothetical protein M3Y97_01069900 [Aphelenchoides bicaudatus]|nr:hypothetical protein M3Y97_01069900 [Aphelenchoides bicaudatus]
MAKKLSARSLVPYLIMQFLGSFCGASVVKIVTSSQLFDQLMAASLYIGHFAEWWNLLLAEFALTTLFLLNFLMCSIDTNENLLAPLSIGLSVSLSVFGAGLTLNPFYNLAVRLIGSMFLDLHDMSFLWRFYWVDWIASLMSVLLSFGLYRTVFSRTARIL